MGSGPSGANFGLREREFESEKKTRAHSFNVLGLMFSMGLIKGIRKESPRIPLGGGPRPYLADIRSRPRIKKNRGWKAEIKVVYSY